MSNTIAIGPDTHKLAKESIESCLAGAPTAMFSPCRTYRYLLTRKWGTGGYWCAFIGLNPSTADESVDDPTIRRCIGFAKLWGYDGLIMLNIFALRSTDPKYLKVHPNPLGECNDLVIDLALWHSKLNVAAWGHHGALFGRGLDVATSVMMRHSLHCLGRTASGSPKHPLYLRGDSKPEPWAPSR